jgi:signal transduction histidine kinase
VSITAKLRLRHKVLLLVAVPLVFQAVFISVLGLLLENAEKEAWKERHSRAVTAECNALLNNLITCGVAIYSYSFTGASLFQNRFEALSESIPLEIEQLRDMLKDSPNQKEALREMQLVSRQSTLLLVRGREFMSADNPVRKADRQEISDMVANLLTVVGDFVHHQQEAERINPQLEARARQRVLMWLLGGFALSVVLAILLALAFDRDITRRVGVLVSNTALLLKGKSLNRPVQGDDEIAHLDLTFHQMADALADASRRKQEIISMVTHDLRSPLTSIQALFTLFEHGVLGTISDHALSKVKAADASTRRLIELINDLLDVEKLESGQMSMDRKPVQLFYAVSSAVEAVGEIAAQKEVEIDYEKNDITILADQNRIIQVLVNLMSNAVKFSPAGQTVNVEMVARETEIEVAIVDRGRGVPEKYREAIFERFSQVQAADGARGKGTGLGLPICKLIIEAHGGKIGCRSEEGKGSTFWFTLPQKPNTEA